MKKVFSSHGEVCHVFASGTQSEGRASRIFFEGDTIYSYGRHFPMARRLDNGAYLFTTRGYSVSTAKHISKLHRALRGSRLIYCNNPSDTLDGNLKHERDTLNNTLEFIGSVKYPTGRGATRVARYAAELAHIVERTTALCAAFDAPAPGWAVLPDNLLDAAADHAKRKAEQEAANRAAVEKAQKEQARKARANLKKWRDGASIDTYGFHALPCALRIIDDTVQTSHGARITVEEVCTSGIWPAVKGCHDAKRAHIFNGLHKPALGYYKADSIDADGTLRAGCHVIPYAEMQRVAAVIFADEV